MTNKRQLQQVFSQPDGFEKNHTACGRDKSDLTPSAQDVTSCVPASAREKVLTNVATAISLMKRQNPALYVVLDLQLHHALRISEVLGIKLHDISPRGFIKIKGLKGSYDRIVIPVHSIDLVKKYRQIGKNPFIDLDRYYVYREYKKLGIQVYLKENKKYAVTHLFRYLNTNHLFNEFGEGSEIQTYIGHKSPSMTRRYGNKS